MPFIINGRKFDDYMDAVGYQNGWSGWPSWPIVDGEDAPVNTPEAMGYFDREDHEREYASIGRGD